MMSTDPYIEPDDDEPGAPPLDGRDSQPGTGGSQDEPSTLDEEDPLRDALDPIDGDLLLPPPIPDTPRPDPDELPDGSGEETARGAEGPNDEEERFDAG
ncbi:hypothetical protein EV380_1799 [Zhihengliuella halotolerans]|uniref:Uncharacterized protein n=2 Tax=Zhihengliuella halotolerans TaxID=370736 RepID=A0A4Q8AF26_9MICC|nr:hypothetical protein EV380_1799 [Zhihengliuella halotolerans]